MPTFAPPTARGRTALHHAAAAGRVRTAETLVAAGLDVNLRDARGRTALAEAVSEGRDDMVAFLLRSGADPALPDDGGNTPLHLAVKAGGTRRWRCDCWGGGEPLGGRPRRPAGPCGRHMRTRSRAGSSGHWPRARNAQGCRAAVMARGAGGQRRGGRAAVANRVRPEPQVRVQRDPDDRAAVCVALDHPDPRQAFRADRAACKDQRQHAGRAKACAKCRPVVGCSSLCRHVPITSLRGRPGVRPSAVS
ncbi:ankyrin repeat domain-containing protein [Jhaorihella thermophila]